MNKRLLQALLIIAAGSLFASGCAFSPRLAVREPPTEAVPSGEILPILARETPHRHITITPSGQTNVWLSTYWIHADCRWVCVPAHMELASRPNEVWVPGHRAQKLNGEWTWRSGHWAPKKNVVTH